MDGIRFKRKMLALACSAALFAGMSLAADAKPPQNKKEKKEHRAQAQKQDRKQYDQRLAKLQAKKRLAQYRYEQQYYERMLQLHQRYEQARAQGYQNDPFFNTAFDRRYQRANAYYETNEYGIAHLQQATQYGYAEGYQAGMADRQDHWGPGGWVASDAYRDANYGYNGLYVGQEDYNYYFREGFRRGYEDGYNNRAQYGTVVNGNYTLLDRILAAILPFEMLR